MKQALRPLSGPAGLLAGVSGLVALFGTYWDDAWHTDKGRDDFFIAPHLTLYAGVTITGMVTAWWLLRAYGQAGAGVRGVRALLRMPAALLALVGACATLLSAPVDNAWHELYGRDAVLWSPPHMLGVAGSAAMSIGLLAGLAAARGRAVPAARVLLGAGVLGSLLVPVLEFDSDVPQFPVWTYWPVTTAGLVLFVLVVRDLTTGRWTTTAIAAAYTAAKIAIVAALTLMDHSGSLVPPVLAVALADDLLVRRGAIAPIRALTVAGLVPVGWAVAVELQPGQATVVPADQVLLGLAASLAAALVVLLATGRLRLPRRMNGQPAMAALVIAAVCVVTVVAPSQVWAHDPGQGLPAGTVGFDVVRDADSVRLTARLAPQDQSCDDLRPVEAVARRADTVLRAGLTLTGCDAQATMDLPDDGRWFLYVDLLAPTAQEDRQQLEAWVPFAGKAAGVRETRDLYIRKPDADRTATATQIAAGVLLYAVVLGLLTAAVRLAGRTSEGSRGAAAPAAAGRAA